MTNVLWKLNATSLASFGYTLGLTGNRTALSETLTNVSHGYAWNYDALYRLTNETLSTTAPTGTLGYQYDAVGNRTNRTSSVSGISTTSSSYNTNDWLATDGYDMSHPFTRIVFRVGDDDAKKLAEGFSYFEARDFRNLETGQAIARVERSDFDFNLSVPLPVEPDKAMSAIRRQEVITGSRNKYGMARADVEAILAKSRESVATVESPTSPPVKLATEAPKVAEVLKATGSENKVMVPDEVKPPVIAEVQKTPRDLGRGTG